MTHLFNSVRGRLAATVALFGIALVAIVAVLTWTDADSIFAARRDQLERVSQVALKVVEQQYEHFKAGKITEAEAQERAKAAI